MTQHLRPPRWRRVLLAWPTARGLVTGIALAGLATLLYPSAASWFADRAQAGQVDAYVHAIESISPGEARAEMRAAHRFNATVPEGAPHDPYASGAQGAGTVRESEAHRYQRTLDLDPGGMMGVLTFPGIDVQLPIHHGTAPKTLDRGIGHLFGSALPVGGPGTHSVLTGHSGLVHATMLTHLDRARVGDRFTVTVLNDVLTYQVDRISVVEPTELDNVAAVPNRDYLTLITCTPTGVNTHRLLVRGVRVPTDVPPLASSVIQAGEPDLFPWWAVWAALGLIGIIGGTSVLAPAPVAQRPEETLSDAESVGSAAR